MSAYAKATTSHLSDEMLVAAAVSRRITGDFDGGLRGARRALKRGARRSSSMPIPHCDTHLQALELLRATSHVRSYTASEWIAALARSGFALQACQT